jgi:hypothetical protein
MSTDITTEYWVHIALSDGHELTPHAAQTADEAEAMATRLAGICRVLHQPVLTWIVQQRAAKRRA